jgi:hypothetical protein
MAGDGERENGANGDDGQARGGLHACLLAFFY